MYQIGAAQERHDTLRDALVARFRRNGKSQEEEILWALKDVSFEVKRGEVVGVIGRNGAGKSTLLKILSRITEPTTGHAEIHGRVGSLLEVGTGFHPELTGRENVYLSGAILGMKRAEIDRKFDEIVDFSGIEKFLDTPFKRYSSGMRVRLGFAVAAHLDPEILLVDEVLAVGDVAFQKKCLGKMGDVAQEGRTVLFVSHNMDAILNLCGSVVVLSNGSNSARMAPERAVRQYLNRFDSAQGLVLLEHRDRFQLKPRKPIFRELVITEGKGNLNVVTSGSEVNFIIGMYDISDLKNLVCALVITDERTHRVVLFHTGYHSNLVFDGMDCIYLSCRVPSLPLVPGTYFVDLVLGGNKQIYERVEQAGKFEVVFSDLFGTGQIPNSRQGYFALPCDWNITRDN
jgi:lipopolysaccharide transport system ATP-binding protein